MHNPQATDSIRYGRVSPNIQVTNMENALKFYLDILGMKVTFTNGGTVSDQGSSASKFSFVIVEKDSAEIHLTLNPKHVSSKENVAHMIVDDAKAVYEHIQSQGVKIVKELRDHDFDMRAFVMADPDGNCIDVGQYL
jgi:uncharacterized glyoxalase superfamily protein PhnB